MRCSPLTSRTVRHICKKTSDIGTAERTIRTTVVIHRIVINVPGFVACVCAVDGEGRVEVEEVVSATVGCYDTGLDFSVRVGGLI